MILIDKSLPYPYLPEYTGTRDDREKIFKQRVKILLESLSELEATFSRNKYDLNLLADLERCQGIVNQIQEDL